MNAIEASDVRVTLGGQPIVRGVDLTVPTGQVLALLGANGSGKSTLVRALLGVVPLAGGTVRLLGEPLGRAVPWRRVGYVPQRMAAGGGVPATALEVVVSGLLHGRRLRPPRDSHARAAAALEALGVADLRDRRVQEMSGGQQQRVLIARALVREPALLVLDEPTSGIDLPTQESFVRVLSSLRDAGTTVVVILHEIGSFAPLIDRAVVLRHGRVVHDGPPPPARGEHGDAGHDHTHPHADPGPPTDGPDLTLEVTR
ncbi:metal ABC transporter ATP-binding protein [Cellulomonas wangsupingiae]|uniref:Metal ABC transporter ATP-binding protein n=1 Tax=Cellulomonas wangsupingiae TaxID=2968085 RepID=A0ABY5K172_9CELL|nr:metal ABC transporter ATP-binding protein [Cellulomonas wangsupingiae]MCC2333586.1 metal ABC transporter ATP-binding protein [Cellulomonas wangsupingiae]MCM0641515.1 metal ABC transporter ATP-binding protein [Cellulomonas wangsupingiae]UUI63765.1 metal ABC transporter ATP-binding protein [Cellulomonas wangsupingiae]